jgi:hypothetical protein
VLSLRGPSEVRGAGVVGTGDGALFELEGALFELEGAKTAAVDAFSTLNES